MLKELIIFSSTNSGSETFPVSANEITVKLRKYRSESEFEHISSPKDVAPICYLLHKELNVQFVLFQKENVSKYTVFKDEAKSPIGEIALLYDDSENISLIYNKSTASPFIQQVGLLSCPLCKQPLAKKVNYALPCKHQYHLDCIKDVILKLSQDSYFSCKNPGCEHKIAVKSIQKEFGKDTTEKDKDKVEEEKHLLNKCVLCEQKITYKEEETEFPNCKHTFHAACFQNKYSDVKVCPICHESNPSSSCKCLICSLAIKLADSKYNITCCKVSYHQDCITNYCLKHTNDDAICPSCNEKINKFEYKELVKASGSSEPICEKCKYKTKSEEKLEIFIKCGHKWHKECLKNECESKGCGISECPKCKHKLEGTPAKTAHKKKELSKLCDKCSKTIESGNCLKLECKHSYHSGCVKKVATGISVYCEKCKVHKTIISGNSLSKTEASSGGSTRGRVRK